MTIFKGKSKVCGMTLVVDEVWRYKLPEGDILKWTLEDANGQTVLEKTYTGADVDDYDKVIVVNITAEETLQLSPGAYYFTASVNDMHVSGPTFIEVRE